MNSRQTNPDQRSSHTAPVHDDADKVHGLHTYAQVLHQRASEALLSGEVLVCLFGDRRRPGWRVRSCAIPIVSWCGCVRNPAPMAIPQRRNLRWSLGFVAGRSSAS